MGRHEALILQKTKTNRNVHAENDDNDYNDRDDRQVIGLFTSKTSKPCGTVYDVDLDAPVQILQTICGTKQKILCKCSYM